MFAALCRVVNGMDGALMGFEQEAVSELYASVWGNRSKMQREFTRGAHGEQFVLRELSLKAPRRRRSWRLRFKLAQAVSPPCCHHWKRRAGLRATLILMIGASSA